jgi:hypothetical protein
MAAKKTPAKKKKAFKRVPVAYHIEVNVDYAGNFTYSAAGIPDASSIKLSNGDTLDWSAKLMGIPVPFQVEFPGFGPFGPGKRVIRSMFGATTPLTAALPSYYRGNLVFEYTVSIANGWSDDPDIETVPGSPDNHDLATQTVSMSIYNSTLALDKQDTPGFLKGLVKWDWAGTPLDDFTLTFDALGLPAGWPLSTDSQSEKLVLNLLTAGSQAYTIETLNLGLSVRGTLTIT